MNWLLLTVLAICSRAGLSIATKIQGRLAKVSSITQAVLLTCAATVLTLLISPLLGGFSTRGLSDLWLVTIVMMLSQAFGNILFFKGLEKLEASVASVAFSSVLLWGAVLSVALLGSSFSGKQLIGIVVLLVAIVLVQYQRGSFKLKPGVAAIIAAAGPFAVFQVTSAEMARTVEPATYLLLAYGGSTVIIWLAYFRRVNRELTDLSKRLSTVAGPVLSSAATSLLYFVFSYFAYKLAPDRGVVVLLLTSQVVLSVILGIIFLNERDHVGRKLTAGMLALLAGILIKS